MATCSASDRYRRRYQAPGAISRRAALNSGNMRLSQRVARRTFRARRTVARCTVARVRCLLSSALHDRYPAGISLTDGRAVHPVHGSPISPGPGRETGRSIAARGRDRQARRRRRARTARVAPVSPPAARALQPRAGDREVHRRSPQVLRTRTEDRRRPHRRRRHSEGRQARPGGGAARRHGRVAGSRRGRRPLRQQGDVQVRRAGRRRDARLRARHAHGHPAGDRPHPDASPGSAPRHGQVHLPAGGRGRARERAAGRRRTDGQGRRAGESEGRGHLRPARLRQRPGRTHHLSQRLVHGRCRTRSRSSSRDARRMGRCRGAASIRSSWARRS